jgi:hypothetical protein
MTKKDYQAIAEVLSTLADKYQYDEGKNIIAEVALDLADIMQDDNPRFSRETFLDACGYSLL